VNTAACLFILLDTLVIHVPFSRKLILACLTPSSDSAASQSRLVGQVAARIVGAVFLVLMFPPAIQTIMDPEMRSSFYNALYRASPASHRCIQVASSYFVYDTYICLFRFAENGMPFLLHGVLCCLAYSYPLISGNMHFQGACFLMWELSTPFLYLRWFLIKARCRDVRKKAAWQGVANALFAVAFFACRIVYGPVMSYQYYVASQWDLGRGGEIPKGVVYGYHTAMLVLNGLNYWWFSAIVRVALGKGGQTAMEATEAPASPKRER